MRIVIMSLLSVLLSACGGESKNDVSIPPQPPPLNDTSPPVITLLGQSSIFHEQGIEYYDLGARALDQVDGSVAVSITGAVDVNIEGTYELQFKAQDSAGNVSTLIREVEVVAPGIDAFVSNATIQQALPSSYINSVEALIKAHDEVIAGDYSAARERIDAIFAVQPFSDDVWNHGVSVKGLNAGHPVAYYGLRMLDEITKVGEVVTQNTLQITAVIASCATIERLSWPDLSPEMVDVTIDPTIMNNNYHLLYESTDLFRRWIKAITRGSELKLVVHELNQCTNVSSEREGNVVIAYPDYGQMMMDVPEEIKNKTDMWWVIAPSAVPGDGSGFNLHFITGGMGLIDDKPLLLSDDAWFTRKPEHLGSGIYLQVERRSYQPQWFQHEFMHHLYQTWPEFQLEASDHQWFDRSMWPDDFVGKWEPDYFAESIEKRLLNASPTLASGLDRTD
ncbi:DUF5011 domain-containing protein [Rheinheimera baltica]|uniref:DUF5011 domain-containing protein n=1 Tax=Rheinheimera baltica TaxID=67576 RepID=A0ABT9HXP4_9GAMM|nr:immunoglobulin-like domain-containing protein [Rheinheimera baltica]MDP5135738.1 DUF5011 domain-containing protein [Rheinheimera baltica]